jgi:hypothetical protein
MFELITGAANLLFLSAAMTFTITFHLIGTTHLDPNVRDSVYPVHGFVSGFFRPRCDYTGVMVPFVRDWAETLDEGKPTERVLPPDPDTTVGQAYIFTKVVCDGKPAEHVLLVDEDWRAVTRIADGHTINAQNYYGIRPDQRPKWFDQVVARIQRVAPQSQVAQEALADMAAYTEQVKAQAAAAAAASGAVAASAPAAAAQDSASTPAAASAQPVAAAVPASATAQSN